MQESAALNVGHRWRWMKSTTCPDTPGPRTIRSVRFPMAPPRTSPSPTAVEGRVTFRAYHTMAAEIPRLAAKNTQGTPAKRLNAPPVFVV